MNLKLNYYAVWVCIFFLSYFFLSYYINFGFSQSSIIRVSLGVLLPLVLLALFKKGNLKSELKRLFVSRDSLFLLLFFLYIIIQSIFYADWQIMRRVIILLVFFIFLSLLDSIDWALIKCKVFVVPVLAAAIGVTYLYSYIVSNGFTVPIKNNAMASSGYDFFIDYKNTVLAGLHLVFLLSFCLHCYFYSKNTVFSIFSYFSSFLILSSIFLTVARTAWVVCCVVLIIYFLFSFKRRIKKVFFVFMPLVILAATYLYFYFAFHIERGLTRRDEIWSHVLSQVDSVKSVLFGSGIGSPVDFVKLSGSGFMPHFHNIYLELFYKVGIIGLIVFLLLNLRVLFILYSKRRCEINILYFSLLGSVLVGMFFDYSNLIYSPNLMWLVYWFPLALAYSSTRKVDGNSNGYKK